MAVSMLTTTDNPYDPFDQYEDWFSFDLQMGYDTPGYLARIADMSTAMSEPDQEQAIQDAIDEIVRLNINGMYTKVSR